MISNTPVELHEDLKPFLTTTDFGMKCIHHPLVVSVMHHELLNEHTNKRYEYLKDEVEKCFENGDYDRYVFLHERPYRLNALIDVSEQDNDSREYWDLVKSVYTDSENIHQNFSDWYEILTTKSNNKKQLMNSIERKALSFMGDEITVYRGYNSKGSEYGLSWTYDKKIAEFFAKRFVNRGDSGTIAVGKVKKSDVIAYFSCRTEHELIIDPDNVTIIKSENIDV